jgi:YD repeat-containing protein
MRARQDPRPSLPLPLVIPLVRKTLRPVPALLGSLRVPMKRPRRRTKISAHSAQARRLGKSSCAFTSTNTAVARLAPLVRKTLPSVTVPVLLLLDLLCECPHHLYAATSPGFGARAERGGGVVVRYAWIARGRVIGEADSRVIERGMVGSKRR